MQTSYEVIKNAIYFNKPNRLPVQFDSLGYSDTHFIDINFAGSNDENTGEKIDLWGCRWTKTEVKNMGQVKGHPLDELSKTNRYSWPDPDSPELYEHMESKFKNSGDKYIMTRIPFLLFERIHALRGFENALADLYLEREKIEELADNIVDFNVRVIENVASRFPGKIHGFKFTDDWGTEQSTMISVELWNEFFKPRYKKIFDACKKSEWDIWMHSCGKINNIIPSLIDIGLDVINMQQPRVNGIEEIGSRFAGKICFSTLCDIQKTLPFETADKIEEEAIKLMKYWGTENGGFILSDYGNGEAIGVGDNKKKIMFNAFKKHDRWRAMS